jgi:hypothetical protein
MKKPTKKSQRGQAVRERKRREKDPLLAAVDRAVIDGLVNATVARKIRSARSRVKLLADALENATREATAEGVARRAAEEERNVLKRQIQAVEHVHSRVLRDGLLDSNPPHAVDARRGPGAVAEAIEVRLRELATQTRPNVRGFLDRLAAAVEHKCGMRAE